MNSQKQAKTPKKRPLIERLAEASELPTDTLTGLPQLSLAGNRRLDVEGCRGIIEYSDKEVRINAGKMILQVEGRELELASLEQNRLSVAGFIEQLRFLD